MFQRTQNMFQITGTLGGLNPLQIKQKPYEGPPSRRFKKAPAREPVFSPAFILLQYIYLYYIYANICMYV